MSKLRLWLADKLVGDKSYIKNVTFYQTVCVDIDSCIYMNKCSVELSHDKKWKGESDKIGINFDHYKT